jgi:uncharacterized protein involved in exopolysaccharide biosynthesis
VKRFVKKLLLGCYARTEFIRRPMRAELQAEMRSSVSGTFEEVRVVLEDLVTEVYRLQRQVSELQDEVARLRDPNESTFSQTR